MPRYAILASGAFDYILNKTGNMLIRYEPQSVFAVIDRENAGKSVQEILGYGGNIPVVGSFKDSIQFNPDTLVIGNAPQGGFISPEHKEEILSAIKNNCHVISGMHVFLKDDEEISSTAVKYGVSLIDLRKPPDPPHFPKGTWKERKIPVLLTVGTDCDSGKMTTAWEISVHLQKKGWKAKYIGTGQTGILLGGRGVPVDAVRGDFMAGEIEHVIDKCSGNCDCIIVEGQGAIAHMLYSGVTLGLLHGSMPDFMILTHDTNRKMDTAGQPMLSLEKTMDQCVDLVTLFKPSKFIGINLMTVHLDEITALNVCESIQDKHHLPTTDLVRFGERGLIEHIDFELRKWN